MHTDRDEFFCLRHGKANFRETDFEKKVYGHRDIPLNETGAVQAIIAAYSLLGRGITRIYSSDLSRAFESAKIVAARIGVDGIHTDKRLRERYFGDYEGKMIKRDGHSAWTFTDKEAEPHEAFARRINEGLSSALEGTDGLPLIVSHGGMRRVLQAGLGIVIPDGGEVHGGVLHFWRRTTSSPWQAEVVKGQESVHAPGLRTIALAC